MKDVGLSARLPIPALALLLLLVSSASAQARHEERRLERPERTVVSSEDIVLYPPAAEGGTFAFLPAGGPQAFDRNIVLSAAPGETRSYLLETVAGPGKEPKIVAYVVDKRRPKAPRAEPGTGLFYSPVRPTLSSEGAATIMWALVGSDGSAGNFRPYSPKSRPELVPPAKGSATATLVAYSVSKSGLRSYPSSFSYRLAEPGLPVSGPRAETIALAADPDLPAPRIEQKAGYAELSLGLPPGASLLADFSAAAPPEDLNDFERFDESGAGAGLRIPCPYGWSGVVKLYYGVLNGESASYNPEPVTLRLAYPAEATVEPEVPPAPVVAADPSGQGGFLAFPAYDGRIYVAVGEGKPAPYASPIPLSRGSGELKLSWYGVDARGRRSASKDGTFSLPQGLKDVDLRGVEDGAYLSGDAMLKPDPEAAAVLDALKGKASLRYELRIDGSFPPEPSQASPEIGEALSIACPPGEERLVVLRYRLVAGAEASEGKILRFTLDRKPPDAPRAVAQADGFHDKPLSLELKPGAGAKTIFASVSVEGEAAPFALVSGPLYLPGSEAGPISYRVRAYDVDTAGNKSAEMSPVSVVVDTASVYASEDGNDGGDGSPARPFKTLDAAIAAAQGDGKANVNVRGSVDLRGRVEIRRSLKIVGGFDGAWGKDASIRSRVTAAKGAGLAVFGGAQLGVARIAMTASDMGPSPLFELEGSGLSVSEVSIAASSDGDALLVQATASKIVVSSSRIAAAKGMSFTLFSVDGSSLAVSESALEAYKDVRVFCAVDADSGSVAIGRSSLASRADLGLSLLSLRNSSLSVDRCLVDARGGKGFLRLGLFKSVSGEVRNSKAAVAWSGPGTLFEAEDGGPAFKHDTIVASDDEGGLRFFDVKGETNRIWNCILDASGPGAELLRSDTPPAEGALAADCVWGFSSLVSGALEVSRVKDLNGLNARSVVFSSKPIVAEPPDATFDSPIKSESSLRKGSICVGGALSLGSGYETDFSGRPRPGPGKSAPDIGADEFSD